MGKQWNMSSLYNIAKYLSKKTDRQYFICWFESKYVIRQKAVGDMLYVVEPNGNIWS